jgi:hypothetical protein
MKYDGIEYNWKCTKCEKPIYHGDAYIRQGQTKTHLTCPEVTEKPVSVTKKEVAKV